MGSSTEPKAKRPFLCKAYEDLEFIHSSDARVIRILSEFLEPARRFRKHRISDTIVFFGSSRVLPSEEAKRELEMLQARNQSDPDHWLALEQARRRVRMAHYYEDARELARLLTIWSKGLGKGKRRFIVCSGGGPGIMEAVSRGAREANGLAIGFNISIPYEQNANPYISEGLDFEFHYFFIRKYWFAYMAKALVIFPGGFGTLDELAELLTLIQTQKITKKVPIVIYGREYWDEVLRFSEMVKWGTIHEDDTKLFCFLDRPQEAFDYLTAELEKAYV